MRAFTSHILQLIITCILRIELKLFIWTYFTWTFKYYILLVYYKIRHEAKTAYSQNTIKSLKTYNIIKSHALHKT